MSTLDYKTVLLATDLSEHSSKIAKRARAIADAAQAKLHIIHVVSHTPMAYGGEFSMPIDAELETALTSQAKTHLADLAKAYNIPTKAQHLEEGSIKNAVTECAKRIEADLIVVGSHAHHGLAVLLGSQSNAILHAAHCDVWIIKN